MSKAYFFLNFLWEPKNPVSSLNPLLMTMKQQIKVTLKVCQEMKNKFFKFL